MIVGASRMAYYLVKELQDIQKRVTVIDNNPARCQEMSENSPACWSSTATAQTPSC